MMNTHSPLRSKSYSRTSYLTPSAKKVRPTFEDNEINDPLDDALSEKYNTCRRDAGMTKWFPKVMES